MALTTVIVNFQARPGQRAAVTELLGQALQRTIAQPHCYDAVLLTDDADPERFYMVQKWSSADAHQAYAQALMGDPKMAPVMALLAAPPDSRYTTHHTSAGGQWGGPQHLEIASDDCDATKAFLSEVFGWRFDEMMPGYDGFWAPGALMGGLRPRQTVEPAPQTIPYLVVDDLDARLARVQAAGGTVTVPVQEIPGAGRFFWFLTPGGVPLAAWESAA